jgi:hypothetical protein
MYKAQYIEYKQLQRAWYELYVDQKDNGERLADWIQDMHHPPAGLGRLLVEIVSECVDTIQEQMQALCNAGELTEDTQFEYATDALGKSAAMIGVRMFRLGQETAYKIKYDDLTPCTCTSMPDDDLENFLKRAAEGPQVVEGDGWVIFDFGKEEEK